MICQDQQIKSLQISMMSFPGLLQSVCERSCLMGSPEDRTQRLARRSRPRYGKTNCNCNTKRNRLYHQPMRNNGLDLPPCTGWNMSFTAKYTDHEVTCPLFANYLSVFTATVWSKRFLGGAINASISIAKGAGGFSIGPNLRYRRMVSNDSLSFALVTFSCINIDDVRKLSTLDSLLHSRLKKIQQAFATGKASPYDVDWQGNTILHVRFITGAFNLAFALIQLQAACSGHHYLRVLRPGHWSDSNLVVEVQKSFLHFFERLHELGVSLNETNDSQM